MFGIFSFFVLAQSLSTPLSDYQYQIGQYQQSYLEYQNKKNIFDQYRDISSEKEKIEATKTVIEKRSLLLKSYLTLLSSTLEKYKSVNVDDTTKIQNQISAQINTLNDFNYPQLQILFYQALTQHQINRRVHLLNLYQKTSVNLNSPQIVDQNLTAITQYLTTVKTISQKPQLGDRFSDFYSDVLEELANCDQLLDQIYKNLVQQAVKSN